MLPLHDTRKHRIKGRDPLLGSPCHARCKATKGLTIELAQALHQCCTTAIAGHEQVAPFASELVLHVRVHPNLYCMWPFRMKYKLGCG